MLSPHDDADQQPVAAFFSSEEMMFNMAAVFLGAPGGLFVLAPAHAMFLIDRSDALPAGIGVVAAIGLASLLRGVILQWKRCIVDVT